MIKLFPTDYAESRTHFRTLCSARATAKDTVRAHPIPSRVDPDLTVDVASFARGGQDLLVLISGTHGPEGYAGAAIQFLLLEKHLHALLARGIDVLLVHALNPFGFKYDRRVDEDNVNLNRNFQTDPAGYRAVNQGYRTFRGLFEPAGRPRLARAAYLASDVRLLRQLARDRGNKRPLSEAMNSGQFEFAKGLNYGGVAPAPQVALLREALTPAVATHRRTVALDLHTGLGRRGVLHWMADEAPTPALKAALTPMIDQLARGAIEVTRVADDPDFYRTTGSVAAFVNSLAREENQVLGVTVEFGTLGADTLAQLRSAHRLIVENQFWFAGDRDSRAARVVRRDYLDLFNPKDPAWRAGVLDRADQVLSSLTSGLGVSSKR